MWPGMPWATNAVGDALLDEALLRDQTKPHAGDGIYGEGGDGTDAAPATGVPTPIDMQIFVKTSTGKTVTFEVNAADTVADVKARIQAKEGIPPAQQTLFSDEATMLEDRKTLADCGIGREANLHLLLAGGTLHLARTALSRRGAGLVAMACVLSVCLGFVLGRPEESSPLVPAPPPPPPPPRMCTAVTLDTCLPGGWCRGLSAYHNTVPTTVDGSSLDFNCREANGAYSWVASSGGFLGSDAGAFLAEVTRGLAGPYVLELDISPGISATQPIQSGQTVVIRGAALAWGSGGFAVLERGAIWIQALTISGETTVHRGGSLDISRSTAGNITVQSGGSASLSGSVISGDSTVQGVIVIRGGTISGEITVQSGGSANISGSIVTGDLITQTGGALQLSQVSCSQCHHSMYMFSLTDGADAGAMARAKAQLQRSTFLQPAMPCAVRRPHTSIKYSRVVQP